MVWGRTHAARRAPEIDLADAPIPQSASCSRCETTVILAAGKLPKGWLLVEGEAVCGDCAWSKAEDGQGRVIAPRVRHVEIGPKGVRHTGCRIGAEIVHGFAEVEVRAGASAPPGRDDRVRFLLDRAGLERLELEIRSIRNSLPTGDK